MAASNKKTPYELLNVPEDITYPKLRQVYRQSIHDYNQKRISVEDFRKKIRAYETLSDFEKRDLYKSRQEWTSELPLVKYNAQQLAAEPTLLPILQDRLRNSNLTEINARDMKTGHTILYCAARSGNVESVKYLTEQGAEADLQQRTRSTALHAASFFQHAQVVRTLLESGADYRITNEGGSTAEEEASTEDVKRTFIELKSQPYVRAAVNEMDWFTNNTLTKHIDEEYYAQRQTLLHCASKKNHFDLVRLLVERLSANLDIVDVNGNSALHLAAYGGHTEIVQYLLNRGCNSTLTNKWSLTAEEEGSKYGNRITSLFQALRDKNMFEMARNGVDWWFEYYFGSKSPDSTDTNGTSLLYHACRYGKVSVAKWLLDHKANVDIKMEAHPKSTSLHGAKCHGHLAVIELLLEYGADVTIKNEDEVTVFEEGLPKDLDADTASKINALLHQYRQNLQGNKLLDIHIFLDDESGQDPNAKIQLNYAAVYADLVQALPNSLKGKAQYFSIARWPLKFPKDDTTIISALYCARYASSHFIETPLRLTLHRTPLRRDPPARPSRQFDFRSFIRTFKNAAKSNTVVLKPSTSKQIVDIAELTFTFSESSVKETISFEVKTISLPDPSTFNLPGCLCLFETSPNEDTGKLLELPLVAMRGYPDARLCTLAKPSPYWCGNHTRRVRLPILDGIHAFFKYVSVIPMTLTIIPKTLTIPPDMIIAANLEQPLLSQEEPFKCTYILLRNRDPVHYPKKAFHGTSISVVQSILNDGLVVPGTVVGSGKRISPPSNHIPRGREAFEISDFADAVFLSPSVHYSSDPTYAIAFPSGDQQLLPVLECGVKRDSYNIFPCTVPSYTPHESDDMKAIEWRVRDPADVVINAVLFIPTLESVEVTKGARLCKIT